MPRGTEGAINPNQDPFPLIRSSELWNAGVRISYSFQEAP